MPRTTRSNEEQIGPAESGLKRAPCDKVRIVRLLTTIVASSVFVGGLGGASGCGGTHGPAQPDPLASTTVVECSEITCLDGVHVSIVSAAATFTPGGYAITLTLGDVVEECSFELLDGADECGLESPCLGPSDCNADFGLFGPNQSIAFFVESVGATGASSQASGQEASADGPAPLGPPLLDVVVQRAGVVVYADVLAPQYVEFTPNGDGCDPVCLVGQASIIVPPT